MYRDIRIYSNQFPPWFDQKNKEQKMRIAFALEQIVVDKNWPFHLFQQNVLYPELLLLPVEVAHEKVQHLYTVIGFCPMKTERRFVVLMGCDQAPAAVHTPCLEKAERLRSNYPIR